MNYYSTYRPPSGYSYIRPRIFRGAVKNLIIANGVVFLVMVLLRAERYFVVYFGLVPQAIINRGYIWQLCTYLFIHGGFGHLFVNMFVLWMFGQEIEYNWGKREFYKYYFLTGVGSGLLTLLFSWNSPIPVVGASGAIYGILLAFALLFPERYINVYFLIPIKAKYFVLIMGAVTFFSTFSSSASNISHLTHLGGLLVGYVYLRRDRFWHLPRIHLPRFHLPQLHWNWKNPLHRLFRTKTRRPDQPPSYQTEETMREELDRILDKVSRDGYDNLTTVEKNTLYLVSKYFADKDRKKN